jgi:hypothetical protein
VGGRWRRLRRIGADLILHGRCLGNFGSVDLVL